MTDMSVINGVKIMPRVVDKKKKAKEIVQAALKVFREVGFHRARMADIAKETGIGKGTIYEYFEDKAHILRFAFEEYFDAFKEGVLIAMEEADSPARKLLALVDFALRHADDWEDHCSVYVDYLGEARARAENPFYLTEIYSEMRSILTLLIEQGQAAGEIRGELDPHGTAEILVSFFEGIVLHGVFEGRQIESGSMRESTLELLTRGMLTDPQAVRTRNKGP